MSEGVQTTTAIPIDWLQEEVARLSRDIERTRAELEQLMGRRAYAIDMMQRAGLQVKGIVAVPVPRAQGHMGQAGVGMMRARVTRPRSPREHDLELVLAALYAAGPEGMTVGDVALACDMPPGTAGGRLSDLKNAGRVRHRKPRWFHPDHCDAITIDSAGVAVNAAPAKPTQLSGMSSERVAAVRQQLELNGFTFGGAPVEQAKQGANKAV